MAAGFDGSIRIDTRIDGKGFNSGIKAIMGSLSGVAAAVGVAFGVGAVVNFTKSAVASATELASAMTGLQSIMNGQGKSFSDAKRFINDYVSDGLIPATNAINAYKNLALSGFSNTEIEAMLVRIKDAAAFGRQSSLSLGQAVQSATEGIKNENSILVDNAGITKNLSKMWEDYADSIGKGVNSLTDAEKRQATINGIMEETRFQTGDAAKLAKGYAGQVSALSASFTQFKVAVGNTVIPILAQIIPIVKGIINQLTVLFTTFSQIVQAFFGADASATVEAVASAADAEADLADETKKAGKAAKGALASFDELNVLQKEQVEGIDTAPAEIVTPEVQPVINIPDSTLAQVEEFKEKMLVVFQPIMDAFGRLQEALAPLGETIWEGLKWAWDNILVPMGNWVLSEVVPLFLDLLAEGAIVLNDALIALKPLGLWLWENLLKPLGEWTGGVILDILKWITDKLRELSVWIQNNQVGFQIFVSILGIVAAAIFLLVNPVIIVIAIIGALIAIGAVMVSNWLKHWEAIRKGASDAADWIARVWNAAGAWFQANVIDPIKNGFKIGLEWIREKWETTFNGIRDFVKGTVNTIIDFINGMIRAVAGGINSVIGGLNNIRVTIPDWVPGIGGQGWALNIPTVAVPQIPRLASGAVIPPNAEFAAILGDQRSGRNIETPEGLMRQIVREEMGEQKVIIEFAGTGEEIARLLRPKIKQEDRRIGKSLIVGANA